MSGDGAGSRFPAANGSAGLPRWLGRGLDISQADSWYSPDSVRLGVHIGFDRAKVSVDLRRFFVQLRRAIRYRTFSRSISKQPVALGRISLRADPVLSIGACCTAGGGVSSALGNKGCIEWALQNRPA